MYIQASDSSEAPGQNSAPPKQSRKIEWTTRIVQTIMFAQKRVNTGFAWTRENASTHRYSKLVIDYIRRLVYCSAQSRIPIVVIITKHVLVSEVHNTNRVHVNNSLADFQSGKSKAQRNLGLTTCWSVICYA